jgi:hypothetical protein
MAAFSLTAVCSALPVLKQNPELKKQEKVKNIMRPEKKDFCLKPWKEKLPGRCVTAK